MYPETLGTHRTPTSLRDSIADMMAGESPASLPQIVEMTKPPNNVRPTLPEEMDEQLKTLVRDCWHADASLRPSFEVIVVKLRMIVRRQGSSRRMRPSTMKLLASDQNGNNKSDDQEGKEKEAAVKLCKDIHDALWRCRPGLWDDKTAAKLVLHDAEVSASDPVLHEIVKADRGAEAIRSCGQLMIGNMEDGSEVIPDPLLETDIVVNLQDGTALLTVRFSVSAGTTKGGGGKSSATEFGGLLEAALVEEAGVLEVEETPLTMAVGEGRKVGASSALGSGKTKGRPVRKKVKVKKTARSRAAGRPKRGSAEDTFERFVKAARFVRFGDGVKILHPGLKLRLFGLLMQAQHGDCGGKKASKSAEKLERLKLKAWASQKGKKRKDAMTEYIKALTEIAPQWKLANLIAGRNSDEGDEISKPKRMMWVIKVGYVKALLNGSLRTRSAMLQSSKSSLKVKYLHIVQGANASQTKAWFESHASQFIGTSR